MAEETGKAEEIVIMQDGTVEIPYFKAFIFNKYGLMEDDTIQVAINQTLKQNGKIHNGDEIAFLPPYAGG